MDQYEIRNALAESLLQMLGKTLREALPEDYIFMLMLQPPEGGCFYVANGVREDVLKMMQEFIDRQKRG